MLKTRWLSACIALLILGSTLLISVPSAQASVRYDTRPISCIVDKGTYRIEVTGTMDVIIASGRTTEIFVTDVRNEQARIAGFHLGIRFINGWANGFQSADNTHGYIEGGGTLEVVIGGLVVASEPVSCWSVQWPQP